MSPSRSLHGFTLFEMVLAIVILGIISAVVAVYLKSPIEGYFDTARRARLVETADFALRRISRDLAAAVPNTIRSNGSRDIIEMLPSSGGGRYCSAEDCADPLTGGAAKSFKVLGPQIAVTANDFVVIANLPGTACDAYGSPTANRRTLTSTSAATDTVAYDAEFDTTCAEVTNRFHIASRPVAYACDAATGTLWRYSNYAVQTGVPATVAALDALGGYKAALATRVDCAGGVSLDDSYKGEGLVELRITITESGESVTLYRQVKVDNTP